MKASFGGVGDVFTVRVTIADLCKRDKINLLSHPHGGVRHHPALHGRARQHQARRGHHPGTVGHSLAQRGKQMTAKQTTDYTVRLKYVLVYQAGIANVFEVQCLNLSSFGRDAKRLLQADFRTCEAFAHGLGRSGHTVKSAQCNQAGDIWDKCWSENLDGAPFSNEFSPVNYQAGRSTIPEIFR